MLLAIAAANAAIRAAAAIVVLMVLGFDMAVAPQ
jgi:hypothetical protein